MGKDPAFLFYSGDFLSGTYTMSNEQVGKYIKLLCLQHQKGRLSEKDMLNICKTYDKDVFSKFIKDKDGYFCNKRLKEESAKRKKYSESRRKNRQNKPVSKTYVKHMEDEDEDVINIKDVKEYFKFQGSEEFAQDFFDHFNAQGWKTGTGRKITNWQSKANVWIKKELNKSGGGKQHFETDPLKGINR